MSASSRRSRQEGADAWYEPGARERFLGKRANEGWQKVDDILDVWFDSGSTHAFVLEDPEHFPGLAGIKRKADGGPDTVMYLEGSDQHRGWFQSSLLESCGTRGRAPFDVVLTHGFVLDEDGHKMSKSLGNVIGAAGRDQAVRRRYPAHVGVRRRLLPTICASAPEILKTTVDTYRKLRNTLRWMLGNLAHFHAAERVAPERMPELERLMLHRLAELDPLVRGAYADFDYKRIFAALSAFMTVDLSAFYFDIRKDALYCDPYSSLDAQGLPHGARSAVPLHRDLARADAVLHRRGSLARARSGGDLGPSRSCSRTCRPSWRDDALAEKWRKLRNLRRVVTGALELERAAKRIGSSLEAASAHLRRRPRPVRRRRSMSILPSCASLRRRPWSRARGRRRRSGSTMCAGVAVEPQLRAGPQMRALLENHRRRSARIRNFPM